MSDDQHDGAMDERCTHGLIKDRNETSIEAETTWERQTAGRSVP